MNSDIYTTYATLKMQIAELEAKADETKTAIMADMLEKGMDKAEFPYGSFSISKRKTWSYPDYVVEQEAELKALKAKAESTEEATYSESESLRFTMAKI